MATATPHADCRRRPSILRFVARLMVPQKQPAREASGFFPTIRPIYSCSVASGLMPAPINLGEALLSAFGIPFDLRAILQIRFIEIIVVKNCDARDAPPLQFSHHSQGASG